MKKSNQNSAVESARAEYIEVAPGIRLHVRDWGQGPAIVLIPGWPLSNDMYDYQMTALAQKGFRVISISQRGFGKSDKPWGPYTYDVYADDLKTLLDRLDVSDVTLGGHSMGGAIAIRYMSRHKGSRVSKLALFGAAAPVWSKREDYPYGLPKSDADALMKSVDIDRPKVLADFGKIFGLTETSINPGVSAWFHAMGMQSSPLAMAQSIAALRDTDLRSELATIGVPTAIFHAPEDRICPFVFAEQLSRGIKKSKIIRFEKSGHALFLEEKEKFNNELMMFAGVSAVTK